MNTKRKLLLGMNKGLDVGTATVDSLLSGLKSYWALDETSTGVSLVTRVDSIGGVNNLTDNGNTPSVVGVISNGTNHSGTKFLSKTTPTLDYVNGFSLSFWANFNAISASRGVLAFRKGTTAVVNVLANFFSGNQIQLLVRNAADTANYTLSFSVPTQGIWEFYVVYYNPITQKIGISKNNGANSEAAAANGILAGVDNMRIGSNAGNNMDGYIDEVGFWNRQLTANEKTRLYSGGVGYRPPF